MTKEQGKFRYRADIDGLRAVAVIGVVLFHAGLGVRGGFVGVDIFFVISGFLITSIILRDLGENNFSMLDFWERRARRIFPALAVVVVATLLVGWFLMLPFGFQVLGQSAVALSVFASNFQFWRTSNYFDPLAEENPLLHTWSLSVEEQFYLVLPLLLFLLFKIQMQRWVGAIFIVGMLASLVLSEWWIERDPEGAFYLLPSRAWELGAGSLMALVRPIEMRLVRKIIGWLGVLLIVYAYTMFDASTAFPGLNALLPVMGSVLLIWSGMPSTEGEKFTGINGILAMKPLVMIGLVSYSFYLWHWPFFAIHRYLLSESPSYLVALVYIGISFGLSYLSYRYIEQPFRQRKLGASKKGIFMITGVVSIFILCAGLSIWMTRGVPHRMPAEVAAYDAVDGDVKYQSALMAGGQNDGIIKSANEVGAELRHLGVPESDHGLVVWGDSHADVLLHVIDEVCREKGIAGTAITQGGVAPVVNWTGGEPSSWQHKKTTRFADAVMDYLRVMSESGKIKHVILAFRWSYYMESAVREPNDPLPGLGFSDALIATVRKLEVMGIEVSLMKEVPIFDTHVPKAVALHHWRGMPLPQLTAREHKENAQSYQLLIEELEKEFPRLHLLDSTAYLLSESGSVRFINDQGTLLYRDEHHLTKDGSFYLKPLFVDLLEADSQ